MMYFLRGYVISGHDGFRHLLLCYLLKTPVLHSWGSLWCPGIGSSNRSCWICGRFPNEPIPKPTKSARISDMDGYFLDVTTRRLVVYGGKEGVLVSPHLLDHLACFAQVNTGDIPQWRVLREHIIRELSLQYAVALSSFHGFLLSGKWDAFSCGWQCKWPRLLIQRKRLTSTIRCQQTVSLRASNG